MDVERELRELGVKPVEGQNFLVSETAIQALVNAGDLEDRKVVEIGAGTGAVTGKILEKTGDVTAVERDSVLAESLGEKFPGIEVLEEDVLETELDGFERAVGNPPFQISSQLLEKLGEAQIQSALILQEELAEKLVAEPGEKSYGPTTVKTKYYFVPVKLQEIPRNSYYPPPEVDTAIVKLYPNMERHGIDDEEAFFEMVNALFTHKMKKTRNAFVDARHILGLEKEKAKQMRDSLPHSDERVVNLELRQFQEIVEAYREMAGSQEF